MHIVEEGTEHARPRLVDPFERHLFLVVRKLPDVVQFGRVLIGIVGQPADGGRLARLPRRGGEHRPAAHLIRLGDVRAAGDMPRTALEGGQLDAARLGLEIARAHVCEIARRARQVLVPERVHAAHVVGQLADVPAVLQLHPFRDGDDDALLFLLHPAHLLDETVDMEWHLGQTDHVHPLAVLSLRERRSGGQPARVSPHDLDDGHIFVAVHRRVADDLLHHRGDVLRRAPVAGGMIGHHQVVVDGLWHADEPHGATVRRAVTRQLADGVHAVVPADIEEHPDVQFVQKREDALVFGDVLFRVPELVAAAPQKRGGRALQELDLELSLQHAVQLDDVAAQKSLHAVFHAVDLCRAHLLRRLKDTRKARVDHARGPARLPYDRVLSCFHPLFLPPFYRRFPRLSLSL